MAIFGDDDKYQKTHQSVRYASGGVTSSVIIHARYGSYYIVLGLTLAQLARPPSGNVTGSILTLTIDKSIYRFCAPC